MTRPTRFSFFLLLLLALLTLSVSACGDAVVSCTQEARVSVNVLVKDAQGAPVSGAKVHYTLDGDMMYMCEDYGDGSYACGYEQRGQFVITAAAGTREAMQSVTVTETSDGCHVKPEVIEMTLEQTGG